MKKQILLCGLILFTVLVNMAQPILNPDFENWTTINYEEPTPWSTSNGDNIRNGTPISVTKVAGISGFAIRMETRAIGNDTSSAYISNTPGDPISGEGGLPYSQLPTAIEGSYRYNLGTTDTAIFLVFFKKNGAVISNDVFKIRGTGSQSVFTPFSFSLSVSATPDSVIIAAASSNAITNVGIQNGSFLELDNLTFTGQGITETILGGDFETWQSFSDEELQDWYTYGDGISKSSPGYSGNYAIQLVTMDYGQDGIKSSGIGSGENSQSGPKSGLPFTQQIDTLCGYYKYFTSGNDLGNIYTNATLNGLSVGGGGISLSPNNNWTYFELKIQSSMPPDSLYIGASSSNNYPIDNSTDGSTLILDHLYMKSQTTLPTTIKHHQFLDVFVQTYPNPATEIVTINWNKKFDEPLLIKIYSITGQLLLSENIAAKQSSYQINVKTFSEGTYCVTLQSSSEIWRTSFIKK